jgi:hypothetical protein
MAGLVGSLAMLLEPNRLGVELDLDVLPTPTGVPLADWLGCFPCYAFVLTSPSERAAECVAAFHDRGLSAAVVGTLDGTGQVRLRQGASTSVVFELATEGITYLRR